MITIVRLSSANPSAAIRQLLTYGFTLEQADDLARTGGRFVEPADMNIDQFALDMKRAGYSVTWSK